MNIKLSLESQDIGPEQARELVRHAAVRYVRERLDPERVTRYAADMACGRWVETPDTLPVTQDGQLLDGLNRLMAVIITGYTLRIAVAEVPQTLRPGWHRGPRWCDLEDSSPWPL